MMHLIDAEGNALPQSANKTINDISWEIFCKRHFSSEKYRFYVHELRGGGVYFLTDGRNSASNRIMIFSNTLQVVIISSIFYADLSPSIFRPVKQRTK